MNLNNVYVIWEYTCLDVTCFFVTLLGHFREITVRTLGECTDLRRQLTSKTIYILVSACSNTKVEEKTNRDVPGMYDLLILAYYYFTQWKHLTCLAASLTKILP